MVDWKDLHKRVDAIGTHIGNVHGKYMKKKTKKLTIRNIVFDHLRACEEMNWDVNFIDVYKSVLRERPESKFNPQHLSVYKSEFTREKKNVR